MLYVSPFRSFAKDTCRFHYQRPLKIRIYKEQQLRLQVTVITHSIHQQSNHSITSLTDESQYSKTMHLCPMSTSLVNAWSQIVQQNYYAYSASCNVYSAVLALRGPTWAHDTKKRDQRGPQTSIIGSSSALSMPPTVPPIVAKRCNIQIINMSKTICVKT